MACRIDRNGTVLEGNVRRRGHCTRAERQYPILDKQPSQKRATYHKFCESSLDSSKFVPETNAGKRLKSTLKEAPKLQKKLALEAENDVEARNK